MENSRDQPVAEKPKEALFIFSVPTAVFILDANLVLLQKIKTADAENPLACS